MAAGLRILLLNSAKKWIGEAAHAFDLYRELLNAGHRPIFGCRAGFELEKAGKQAGYETVAFHFENGFSPLKDISDIRLIRRILDREKIDVVHVHRGKDHWLAAAALLGRHGNTALVRTRHVVTPAKNHAPNRWLYGTWTDFTLSVSRQVELALGGLLEQIPEPRRRVVYSAVNLEKFHPSHRSQSRRKKLGVQPDEVLIGLIARFQNIKGQHIFLQAATRIASKHPQAKFLVSGRSGELRRIKYARAVEEAGLKDRFIVLGYQQELPELLASMDIGVGASLGSEGSSRIALECLASGVPVVATSVGGIPELLQDGRYGILVPPNNSEALAEGICRMIKDEAMRQRLSQDGRRYAEVEKNYTRWLADVLEAYDHARQHARQQWGR